MNAARHSVLPQQRRSRRPAASSRGTRSRAALSSNVTSMASRTAGQKVAPLNTDARLRTASSLGANTKGSATPVRSDRPTSLPLPQRLTPIWLSSLIFLKRSSDVVTFLLVAATLTVYSWTVYTQQQWAQEYRKLETLQRNERHLTMANEGIKDQLAQQAEKPATGLVTPSQANTIFLPPAPQRQSSTTSTNTTDPEPAAKTPLGY